MQIIWAIILVIFVTYLLIVSSLQFNSSRLSKFELKRRKDLGDDEAKSVLNREKALSDLVALRQVVISLVIIIITLLSIVTFGWLMGILTSILIVILYPATSRLGMFRSLSEKLFDRQEAHILNLIKKYRPVIKLIKTNNHTPLKDREISSRQELQHIVEESVGILTNDEKKIIVNGLSFSERKVKEIMTPRSKVDFIKSTEFLGPLVLDDIHKTGHNRLPVVKNDIDHIVGILNTQNLLSLDVKRSVTAEKAMDQKVYYLYEKENLNQVLEAFIKTHQQLFIVINDDGKTLGIVTLRDVVEALIGRQFDEESLDGNEIYKHRPKLHSDN